MQAVATGELVELVGQRAAIPPEFLDEGDDPDHRTDAVLVADGVGVGAVADRLLVTETQAGSPGDPLESGERRREP